MVQMLIEDVDFGRDVADVSSWLLKSGSKDQCLVRSENVIVQSPQALLLNLKTCTRLVVEVDRSGCKSDKHKNNN